MENEPQNTVSKFFDLLEQVLKCNEVLIFDESEWENLDDVDCEYILEFIRGLESKTRKYPSYDKTRINAGKAIKLGIRILELNSYEAQISNMKAHLGIQELLSVDVGSWEFMQS